MPFILTESAGTVTTTTYVTGSAYTSTQPASGSTSGTVIYGYRQSTTTVTTYSSIATTQTVSQQGTTPGTVAVVYPTPATNCKHYCQHVDTHQEHDTNIFRVFQATMLVFNMPSTLAPRTCHTTPTRRTRASTQPSTRHSRHIRLAIHRRLALSAILTRNR